MGDTIQFKRGVVGSIPTGVAGEPLYCTDTKDLYVSDGVNKMSYVRADQTAKQTLVGTFEFPNVIVKDGGTAVVKSAGDDKNVTISHDDTDGKITTSSGDTIIASATDKTLKISPVVYEDLQVSISNVKIPASNAPDINATYNHGIGSGIVFPVIGFGVGEHLFFDVQTTHGMKLNTILDNHIHFILPNTTNTGDKFKFQLDVICAAIGSDFAVPTGSPFTALHTVATGDNTKHRILELADIPASNSTVSTIYKCKLSRVAVPGGDTEYGSDVYLEFSDCHYQKDTMGSRQETAK